MLENRTIPVTGELYRHFKDKLYQIVTIATHSETGEHMVVYQALYGDYRVYVRPLEMFMSEVDHEKYPEVTQKYRFERIRKENAAEQNVRAHEDREDKSSEIAHVEIEQAADVDNADIQPENAAELLINFLDAETYAEKLNILRGMKKHIDDKMAQDMAISLDIVLKEEPLEEKIKDLENCLKTHARFECSRFR